MNEQLKREEKTDFIPTSMPCTEEQFESIKQRLIDCGCKIERLDDFDVFTILVNNLSGNEKVVSNLDNIDKKEFNRTYLHEFNPETFLRNCGIEPKEKPKIFTCKDLSEGRVACEHDSSVEDLTKVLQHCINPLCVPRGDSKYYLKGLFGGFAAQEQTSLPTQSVKVFLKEIEEKEKPKEIKVGDFVRGFYYFRRDSSFSSSKTMDEYIGEIGEVVEVGGDTIKVKFSDGVYFFYPKDQAIEHLVVFNRNDIKVDEEIKKEIEDVEKSKTASDLQVEALRRKIEQPKEIKVGDFVRGFKFEDFYKVGYSEEMDKYIGRIGKVVDVGSVTIEIKFVDGVSFFYPKEEAIEHLANKDLEEFEKGLDANVREYDNHETPMEKAIRQVKENIHTLPQIIESPKEVPQKLYSVYFSLGKIRMIYIDQTDDEVQELKRNSPNWFTIVIEQGNDKGIKIDLKY